MRTTLGLKRLPSSFQVEAGPAMKSCPTELCSDIVAGRGAPFCDVVFVGQGSPSHTLRAQLYLV